MIIIEKDRINDDDLKLAIENGIIDSSYVKAQVDNMRRDYILRNHKYAITACKNGKFYSFLPKPGGGKKQIKRNSREEVEDVIVQFYKNEESNHQTTFMDVYNEWRTFKDQMVSDNTVVKYNTDCDRFFTYSDFAYLPIKNITEDEISVFIKNTTTELFLAKKATKSLFGYLHNTFLFGCRHKYIENDPMQFLASKDFYKYCTESTRSQKEQVINNKDWELLQEKFKKDHEKNPNYIPIYAVEFAALTGMRVGEISALTWDCIFDDYFLINKSEKYNRKTGEYYISKTKTMKDRIFPITDEIRDVLQTVKKIEMQNGYISEFVFSNENGRIHTNVISSCLKNKCRQLGITEKGIHAYRKTLNSKMRLNGVSAIVAGSLLGNSKEVNDEYYTFDISNLAEKQGIIAEINAKDKASGS